MTVEDHYDPFSAHMRLTLWLAAHSRACAASLVIVLTLFSRGRSFAISGHPSLADVALHVTPAAMGFAVNASTMGMAVAGPWSVSISPISTGGSPSLQPGPLAFPDYAIGECARPHHLTILRRLQGLCMASAFALTLAYLGEPCSFAVRRRRLCRLTSPAMSAHHSDRALISRRWSIRWPGVELLFFALLISPARCWVYFTISRVKPMHASLRRNPTRRP